MNRTRIAFERRVEVDHGIERLDFDQDLPLGVFGQVGVGGGDHRQRLAHVADLVSGDGATRCGTLTAGTSLAVNTASTPSRSSAVRGSIERIRPAATGLRTTRA